MEFGQPGVSDRVWILDRIAGTGIFNPTWRWPSALPLVDLVRGEIDDFLAERYYERDHAPWVLLSRKLVVASPIEPAGTNDRGVGVYSNGFLHEHLLAYLRFADPATLGAWYRDCLGREADENGLWHEEAGVTVFATFESETAYFGARGQQTMLNFLVHDLEAMLAQLRDKGADVVLETEDVDGLLNGQRQF
jgi:hypothetical protein